MSEEFDPNRPIFKKGYGFITIPDDVKATIKTKAQLDAYMALKYPPQKDEGAFGEIVDITKKALGRSVIGAPGLPVDVARGLKSAQRLVGVTDEGAAIASRYSPLLRGIDLLASIPAGSQEIISGVETATGKSLTAQPKTPTAQRVQRPLESALGVVGMRNPMTLLKSAPKFFTELGRDVAISGAGGAAAQGVSELMDFGPSQGAAEAATNIATQIALGRLGRKTTASEVAKSAPSMDELSASAKAAWKAIDDKGARVMPTFLNQKIAGIDPKYSFKNDFPVTKKYVVRLQSQNPNKYTFEWLQDIRSDISSELRKGEKQLGPEMAGLMKVRDVIDDVIENASFSTRGGQPITSQEVSDLAKEARRLTMMEKKAESIEEAIRVGLESTSGPSIGIRQEFAKILRNPKQFNRYTKDEQDFIRSAARSNDKAKAISNALDELGTAGTIAAAPSDMGLSAIGLKAGSMLASTLMKIAGDRRIQKAAQTASEAARLGPEGVKAAQAAEVADILRRSRTLGRGTASALYTEGLLGMRPEDR